MDITFRNESSVRYRPCQVPLRPNRKVKFVSRSTDLVTARAQALFVSDVTATSEPSPVEVARAISWALRMYGGVQGCAAEVAAAYGDYPETAAPRMRWARGVVETVYAPASRILQAA
jgi:hypothetical protein